MKFFEQPLSFSSHNSPPKKNSCSRIFFLGGGRREEWGVLRDEEGNGWGEPANTLFFVMWLGLCILENTVFLRKQGGMYLAYDCTEVTIALKYQAHDLTQNSYGIKYRKTIFGFLLQCFIFEKPVGNLWEVLR